MEIERKFLIDRFPVELPLLNRARVEQGYLSTDPTVRIRARRPPDGPADYRLCIKGDGTLVRREVELAIDETVYRELAEILKASCIVKDYRVYALPGGYRLECSHVDPGTPTSFFYAEVEFNSVEQASAFISPSFLGRDVTEDRRYNMAAYWDRKLTGVSMEEE